MLAFSFICSSNSLMANVPPDLHSAFVHRFVRRFEACTELDLTELVINVGAIYQVEEIIIGRQRRNGPHKGLTQDLLVIIVDIEIVIYRTQTSTGYRLP